MGTVSIILPGRLVNQMVSTLRNSLAVLVANVVVLIICLEFILNLPDLLLSVLCNQSPSVPLGRTDNGVYQSNIRLGKHGKWDDTFADKMHPFICTHTGTYVLEKLKEV